MFGFLRRKKKPKQKRMGKIIGVAMHNAKPGEPVKVAVSGYFSTSGPSKVVQSYSTTAGGMVKAGDLLRPKRRKKYQRKRYVVKY